MRCYFTFDEKQGKKVLIPGCWQSLHQEDLSCCTCPKSSAEMQQDERKKEFAELKSEIEALRKENNQLIRIIEKLTKSKS